MKANGRKLLRTIFLYTSVMMIVLLAAACSGSDNAEAPPVEQNQQQPATTGESGTKVPATLEELAAYDGSDRNQLLVEKAKQEGAVNIYTSMSAPDIEFLAAKFTEKYGVKTNVWRSGSVEVRARVITEAGAGKLNVDMVEAVGPDIEAIYREGLLQKINFPANKDLMQEAIPAHQEYVAARMNLIVQAYNTNKIKKEDLPQTYDDLLDPKWKGQLGIEATDDEWMQPLAAAWGEEKGIQYFKDLVRTNGLKVINGHSLLAQMVGTGEVPLGLTVYSYKIDQMKREGQPVEWFALDPAIALPSGIGVPKSAPHPHAAILFYEFLLTDGQQLMMERDITPTKTSLNTALQNVPIQFPDSARLIDELDKWMANYDEIIIKQTTK